jgi:hypothetical protein
MFTMICCPVSKEFFKRKTHYERRFVGRFICVSVVVLLYYPRVHFVCITVDTYDVCMCVTAFVQVLSGLQ